MRFQKVDEVGGGDRAGGEDLIDGLLQDQIRKPLAGAEGFFDFIFGGLTPRSRLRAWAFGDRQPMVPLKLLDNPG